MDIAEGMTWLAAQKFEQDAVTITYSRGETELEISAIRGRTTWETDSEDGATVRMESPDYFVKASDLDALSPPQAGDHILDGDAVYEVMSPGGEHPWQWADWPNRTVFRIHTKQVDTET